MRDVLVAKPITVLLIFELSCGSKVIEFRSFRSFKSAEPVKKWFKKFVNYRVYHPIKVEVSKLAEFLDKK